MSSPLDPGERVSDPDAPVERPGPRHLLWYSVGGSLPERYWPWVLRDVTSRTWAVREFARLLAVLTPFFVLYLVLVPGSIGLRLLTGLTAFGGVILYMFINILVINDRRAVRAGYPSGTAENIRNRRTTDSHHEAVVRRNQRSLERRQGRRG